jgi:cytochrome c peroxidase
MQTLLFLIITSIFSNIALADPFLGLPPLSIPKDNQQSVAKIELGRLLFNDARFSGDNTISCASCHQRKKGFADGLKTPLGINDQTGNRNAPSILNAAFYTTFFLDGRAKTLEDQVLGPFLNPVEHGLNDFKKIISTVQSDSEYRKLFQQVFNISKDQITIAYVSKAIASFERTLIAGNSTFDQYYFGRDKNRLSASAARGLRLFRRKGNCANCHEISWNNALFTDNRFYNIGVGMQRLNPDNAIDASDLSAAQRSELGRYNVTHQLQDIGKFKTPTLRNISLTAPYMHDGSMASLEDVVEYYDKGGESNKFLDAAIYPLHFSKQEKADLVEFLKALTSSDSGLQGD